jgi:hypothetical protein
MAKDVAAKSKSTKVHKAVKPLRKPASTINEPKMKQNTITKKTASEIDDIFSVKVKKQPKMTDDDVAGVHVEKKVKSKELDLPIKKKSHGIVTSSRGNIVSPNPKFERIDADSGLKVYKAHLLTDDGQGGGTPLCPFDCDCCF